MENSEERSPESPITGKYVKARTYMVDKLLTDDNVVVTGLGNLRNGDVYKAILDGDL